MTPNPRVVKAFSAMKDLGVPKECVKPVLKDLLKLYDYNWALIEDDNYRTLADAIFECADKKQKGDKNKNNIECEASEPPQKKLHLKLEEDQVLSTKDDASTMLNLDEAEIPQDSEAPMQMESCRYLNDRKTNFCSSSLPETLGNKGKGPIPSDPGFEVTKSSSEKVSAALYTNQARVRASYDRETSRIGSSEQNLRKKETSLTEYSDSRSLVVSQTASQKNRPSRKINDITKGTERLRISLLDESGSEKLSKFVYIHQNIVYQNAFVQFSLARIADDNCCSKCSGDCLSYSVSCECACETGGEFSYTPEGLLTENFLNACISMNQNPQEHHHVYCSDCPLERAKDGNRPEPCKGHLVRKFIKECWRKCGCDMRCGNRVVQRGITCKLQVFLTNEGKGWGLRALEDLPKGAFVCEYVGEILTNIELYERNRKSGGNVRHTYPVLLDADWSSEGVLKDEDALCLDATFYGNVARFINHRCYDANLLDIPVEVETPDHHYYHIAFFTKRKVDAFEELTWDYGIDFNDHNHPIKAFHCCCRSALCRDKKLMDQFRCI